MSSTEEIDGAIRHRLAQFSNQRPTEKQKKKKRKNRSPFFFFSLK